MCGLNITNPDSTADGTYAKPLGNQLACYQYLKQQKEHLTFESQSMILRLQKHDLTALSYTQCERLHIVT